MQGQHSSQSSFFGMIYEELIPADQKLPKAIVPRALLTPHARFISNFAGLPF